MSGLSRWCLLGLLSLAVLGCSGPSEEASPKQAVSQKAVPSPDAAAIAENNRGVGLMGRFEYEPALTLFAGLVERYPDWTAVHVNLAIATLNRQQTGDESAALTLVDQVLRQDPGNLRAHYVAGLLRLYLSSPAEAMVHFRRVAESDPEDAYAAYYLAQCLGQVGQYEEALIWYRRSMKLDPYLRSAYYGAFQTLRRLRQVAEAKAVMQDYQRLANNPRARLAEFKYTRMGPKGDALAVDLTPASKKPSPPAGVPFAAPKTIQAGAARAHPGATDSEPRALSLTSVDIQGDGRPELFVSGLSIAEGDHNLVLVATDEGYSADRDNPLTRVADVNAALWGDYDNDGLTDVYLARRGPNQLWRQTEKGVWMDVTASTKTGGGERDTVDGVFLDADHDGDLDLFLVNADGPNELLNNNLDGTFRPLGAERGIAGGGGGSRVMLPVDLDGDRDVDLVVVNRDPPHEVYLNDRLWAYRPGKGYDGFRAAPALTAQAADVDADGSPELYTVRPEGTLVRWEPNPSGEYRPTPLGQVVPAGTVWAELAVEDVNGDGRLDILAASPAGWSAFDVSDGSLKRLYEAQAGDTPLAGWTVVPTAPARGPSVLAVGEGGTVQLWGPGPGRYPYLALTLTGAKDAGQSMRSNASGIGARVAVRVDSRWTISDTFPRTSGPGQSAGPLMVGLGGAEAADFIAIDWSDGVFQSELALASGEPHRIGETQRQLSSCPVLFAWDGERYAFVSDLLGVGGLGYAVGPGEYAKVRPWENLLLPEGLLKPREGRYPVKLTEPMEEAAYVDSARLVAYDLPPGWQVVMDERMGIGGPPPTGEPRFYRREILPVRVVDPAGHRVTDSVTRRDGRAAPVGELDRRFIGRLAGEQVLTLSFPQPLDAGPGSPMLVADGWVEYPYSQTLFGAWQAGASFDAPTLEALGTDGQWRVVLERFGYPAGMPRRMSVPLQHLPPGTRTLRLRTNMQVYWDRLAVAYAEAAPEVRRQALPLARARVAETGFPLRTTGEQHRPHYDYNRRQPFWDTRYMAGDYTRLGPVEELVAKADDAVAIIGAGEEVHLEFDTARDPLPRGWTRRFVLESNGWTKDMDLYTRDGETVGPLPSTGKPAGPRDALHARYNTRYLAGR